MDFATRTWDYYGGYFYLRCAFVYKTDDRDALKSGLGLTDSQLSLFEAFDSATWTSVLSNQSSVNYLLNNVSGDIMFKASGDTTIRNLIKNSAYANDFTNNEHWGKILELCTKYSI